MFRPVAFCAGATEAEEPLILLGDALTVALGADARGGALSSPGSLAIGAGGVGAKLNPGGQPPDGVLEAEMDVGEQVGALGRSRSTSASGCPPVEQSAKQITKVTCLGAVEAHAAGGEPTEASASEPVGPRAGGGQLANLVIFGSLGLIAHHVVGGGDLFEALLGLGVVLVGVGVISARQLAVGAGDLFCRRCGGDAQRVVVVLLKPFTLWCHRVPPSACVRGEGVVVDTYERTFTMAGRSSR